MKRRVVALCLCVGEAQVRIVRGYLMEQRIGAGQQVSVQPPGLARPRHFAIPDVQPAGLLAVQAQLLEPLLYPLPFR